jgi:MFS family permease
MSVMRRMVSHVGWWDTLANSGPGRVLAVNAIVDAAGTGMAAVCLPFFAITVLKLSPGQFVLALSGAGVLELLMTVPAGAIAGRIGIRRYSIITRVGRAVVYCLMALTSSFLPFLTISVVLGVLRAGSGGLSQSYVASVVGDEQRSKTLGVIRALRNVGYLVAGGASAALLTVGSGDALRGALVFNGLSFLVSAWCMASLHPQRMVKPPERMDWSVLRDAQYLSLAMLAGVFASSILVLDIALPLWVLGHHDLPTATVAVVAMLNTAMVVLFQYRFSRDAETVPQSVSMLRWSVLAFMATCGLLIVSGWAGAVLGTAAIITAGIMLTLAEMTESPAWWTLAFEMAPRDLSNEYLAAFDLNEAVLNILGPPLMAFIVGAGTIGWVGYAVVLAGAGVLTQILVKARRSRMVVPDPVSILSPSHS